MKAVLKISVKFQSIIGDAYVDWRFSVQLDGLEIFYSSQHGSSYVSKKLKKEGKGNTKYIGLVKRL